MDINHEKRMRLVVLFLVLLSAFGRRWLCQLCLPHIVGDVDVKIWENKIENLGIPAHPMALDTFLDILES